MLARSFATPKAYPIETHRSSVSPTLSLDNTSSASLLNDRTRNIDWVDYIRAPSIAWTLPLMDDNSYPLSFQGIYVGSIDEVISDMAVTTGRDNGEDGSEIVIWAFSRIGQKGVKWVLKGDRYSSDEVRIAR